MVRHKTPESIEERREDQRLAAFTDALLAARAEPGASERPPLADAVELLARTISPQRPPETLRRRLKRCITAEWSRQHSPAGQRWRRVFKRPSRRWAWTAVAALVVVTVLATALLVPAQTGGLTGAVAGETGVTVLALIAVLAGVLAIAFWLARRK
jgi:hypothetical protein